MLSLLSSRFSSKLEGRASGSAVHGFLKDGNGGLIDEVMVIRYDHGHGYTGEEAFEIMCHGSLPVIRMISKMLEELGIREAERGEFTYRAFMHGRMDLTEAEHLIHRAGGVPPDPVRIAEQRVQQIPPLGHRQPPDHQIVVKIEHKTLFLVSHENPSLLFRGKPGFVACLRTTKDALLVISH